MESPSIKPFRAILWIVLSTLLISGSSYVGFYFFRKWEREKRLDDRYQVVAIVQTGPQREPLKTAYLAELMDLSVDQPSNLFAFDTKEARRKLLESPLIKEAKVKKLVPGTIFVDYTVRQPIARLGDYENVAFDWEGYLFPLTPFFTPKNLPEIYLGLPLFGEEEDNEGRPGGRWNQPLRCRHLSAALDFFQLLSRPELRGLFSIVRIDFSQVFSPSYGKREIVLTLEEELWISKGEKRVLCLFPRILRFTPKEHLQQLSNYLVLREKMAKEYRQQISLDENTPDVLLYKTKTIDLRIPHLGFVEAD